MCANVEKHTIGKDRGFLMIGDSFPALNNENSKYVDIYSGLLYIIESGLETATSVAEINKLRIVNMMIRIANAYIGCGINSSTFSDITAI